MVPATLLKYECLYSQVTFYDFKHNFQGQSILERLSMTAL